MCYGPSEYASGTTKSQVRWVWTTVADVTTCGAVSRRRKAQGDQRRAQLPSNRVHKRSRGGIRTCVRVACSTPATGQFARMARCVCLLFVGPGFPRRGQGRGRPVFAEDFDVLVQIGWDLGYGDTRSCACVVRRAFGLQVSARDG